MNKTSGTTALICNSNMFVPYVLTEVLSHIEEQFIIMSDIDNIIKTFQEINLSNAVVLRYYHPSKSTIIKARRKLLKQTSDLNIGRIVFFHAEFGGIINWFIKRKSKECDVYYCKIYNKVPYPRARRLRAFKYRIVNFLMSGVDAEILDQSPILIPSLKDSFFKAIKAKPYPIELDSEKNNLATAKLLRNLNNKAKIVLLTGSTVADGYVVKDEYIKKTDAIIEALGKENCIAKCHPRYNDVFSKELELEAIPSYIPGNLVVGFYDVFISNYSTLLVEAAVAGKIAISLADYFCQREEVQAKQIKAFFENRLQGKGVVYYPKTLKELIEIVESRT